MALDRFVASLDAVEQVEARQRTAFVSDMTAVLASAFAKKGTNPLKDHLDLLDNAWRGGFGGQSK